MNDAELLKRWIETGDAPSFGEVVRRHQTMVFSAALRGCGDAELAQEAAQLAFIALARKARTAAAGPSAGGWLYHAVLLECANLRRKEARREEMKQRFRRETLPDLHRAPSPDGLRDELLENLDSAMLSLREPDRDAIVMRFFEGRSLRETGAALGLTEEAARKRVSRALERLSACFRRRGALSAGAGAAALAALLSDLPAAPVPASLLPSVTASLSGTSLAPLILMTKKQILICSVVVAGGLGPAAWQWKANRELRNENGALKEQLAVETASGPGGRRQGANRNGGVRGSGDGSGADGASASESGAENGSLKPDAARIAGTFGDTGVSQLDRLHTFLTDLQAVTPENAMQIWTEWQARIKQGYSVSWEDEMLCMRLGQVIGQQALDRLKPADADARASTAMARIMAGWACTDPNAASAWFDKLPAGKFRDEMAWCVVDGLMWKDTKLGAQFYSTLPADLQGDRMQPMLWLQSHAGGTKKSAEWFDSFAAEPIKEGDTAEAWEQSRKTGATDVARSLLKQDPPSAAAWLERHAGQPYVSSNTVNEIHRVWSGTDPAAADAWRHRMQNPAPAAK